MRKPLSPLQAFAGRRHPHRRVVRKREMSFGDDLIARVHGNLSGGRVGQYFGVYAVGAAGHDVCPLRAPVFHHEHQRAAIALDHRARWHHATPRLSCGLELHIGIHAGAQRAVTLHAHDGAAGARDRIHQRQQRVHSAAQ